MSDAQVLMKRVWDRYGVLIAVTGEVKKSTSLGRLEGDTPPVTLKALGKLLSPVVDPEDVVIFVPTALEGGSRLAKLADSDDYAQVGEFIKGWVKSGKEAGSAAADRAREPIVKSLERRLKAAEARLGVFPSSTRKSSVPDIEDEDDEREISSNEAALSAEVEHWKQKASQLDTEVRTLQSEAYMAKKEMRFAEEKAGSDKGYQKRYSDAMSLNNALVQSNNKLKEEVTQLRRFNARISPQERDRLKLEDAEIHKQRSAERVEVDCTCLGEVENCQRGCTHGKLIQDGYGNVVG